MAPVDELYGELNAQLAGREVAAKLGNPAGVIMHVCKPDRPFGYRIVFFWEVEVKPKEDDGQGTWSLSFDALDTLGIMRKNTTLSIFRRHMKDATWE